MSCAKGKLMLPEDFSKITRSLNKKIPRYYLESQVFLIILHDSNRPVLMQVLMVGIIRIRVWRGQEEKEKMFTTSCLVASSKER